MNTGSISPDEVLALAHKFYQSVRAHSRLNKRWQYSVDSASGNLATEQCHTHFWKFSRQLLDNKPQSNVDPTFTEEEATEIFSKVYAAPQSFQQPSWMPSPPPPPPPDTEFNCEGITMDEIQWAIKRSRSNSSHCPYLMLFSRGTQHCCLYCKTYSTVVGLTLWSQSSERWLQSN